MLPRGTPSRMASSGIAAPFSVITPLTVTIGTSMFRVSLAWIGGRSNTRTPAPAWHADVTAHVPQEEPQTGSGPLARLPHTGRQEQPDVSNEKQSGAQTSAPGPYPRLVL